MDERTLREIYLPQFEAAVKDAHVGSVMCSYNKLNGAHACANQPLLDGILRHDWGFRGFVLADYAASKTVGTGLAAGLDFEPWPFVDADGGENLTPANVTAALAAGRTTQAAVDHAVRNLMRTLFAYGYFDRAAYVDDDSRVDKAGHLAAARRIEEGGHHPAEEPAPRPAARLEAAALARDHRVGRRRLQATAAAPPT